MKALNKLSQDRAINFLKVNKMWKGCFIRLDGRIEWTCRHGVGHTIWKPKNKSGAHCCDGCCIKFEDKIKKILINQINQTQALPDESDSQERLAHNQ